MSRAISPEPPKTVLVTGANGALGRKIVHDLAAEGRILRAAARGITEGLPEGVTSYEVGTISSTTDWSEALRGVDGIVHCAALTHLPSLRGEGALAAFREVNRDGTLNLAQQAAAARVRRFVFISSATVNGRTSGDQPFRPDGQPNPQTDYSRTKLEAEQGLCVMAAQTELEVAIIRPPRIVWPEVTGNLALLTKLVAKGVPLPFGLVTSNRRDNVSPGSVAGLVRACLDHPCAAGRTFFVTDGDPLSTRDLLERLGRKVGRRPRLLPVPPTLIRLVVAAMPARLLGKLSREEMLDELLGNLELDISETRSILGWEPSASSL